MELVEERERPLLGEGRLGTKCLGAYSQGSRAIGGLQLLPLLVPYKTPTFKQVRLRTNFAQKISDIC